MSEKETAENPKPGAIPEVPPGAGDSALSGIQLEGGSIGYGSGFLDYDPNPNREGRGALGTNISNEGRWDPNVKALQTYMAQELDKDWDKSEFGNTPELKNFGIDGVWRCETQAAYNKLLEQKGLQPCKESGSSECGESVPNCVLDEATLDALKKADEEKEEKEEEAKEEAAEKTPEPPVPDHCYLMANLDTIIRESKPPKESDLYESSGDTRSSIKYKYIHKVHANDPSTVMNKLRMRPGALQFLNIRHWQLSQLVPTIRIYKEFSQGPGKEPREVEIKFNSFVDPVTDLQDMLNSQLQRGVGVGIEYLTYDWVGTNIDTVKSLIKGNLSIYANNFNELLKTRRGFDQYGVELEGGYRIIDLLVNRGIVQALDPSSQGIKVVVGWAATGGGGLMEPELVSAIKDTQLSMYLNVTDYDINVLDKEGGAVRIIATLFPQQERVLLSSEADIFADNEARLRRRERREKYKPLFQSQTDNEVDPEKPDEKKEPSSTTEEASEGEDLSKLRDQYDEEIRQEMENSRQDLLRKLLLNNAVYSLVLSSETFETAPGISSDIEGYGKKTIRIDRADVVPLGCDEVLLTADDGLINNPDNRSINFFFLGDLLEIVLQNVLDKPENWETYYGNTRYILGPTRIPHPDPLKSGKLNLNIADIPISIEMFNDFMSRKLKQSVEFGTEYPLYKFTGEVIKELIFEAMGPDCQDGLARNRTELDISVISADPAFGGLDPLDEKLTSTEKQTEKKNKRAKKKAEKKEETVTPISTSILDLDQYELDFDNPSNSKIVFDSLHRASAGEQYHYLVIHAIDKEPDLWHDPESDETRYERDFKKGIYHFTTGLDRGLVMGTNFSFQNRSPYIRAQRSLDVIRAGVQDPVRVLANLASVDLEMYGNNFLFPNDTFYLNPRGLGADLLGEPSDTNTPSVSNILGIGGYHRVINVSNRIDRTGFKTSVRALATRLGDDPRSAPDADGVAGDVSTKAASGDKNNG